MNMVLVPLHGGAAIPLEKAITFFGRGSECDVVLTDSRKVSRKHCCVAQIDERIVVRDLGSMNGVRINEKDVKPESVLNVGDVLWVGDLGFRLEARGASHRKPASTTPQARAASKKQPPPGPAAPHLLSQDFPVPIEEQPEDFQSEQTGPQAQIPDDEVIALSDDDLIDDNDCH